MTRADAIPTNKPLIAGAHFNADNVGKMLAQPPLDYNWIRFDPNDDCNLHCVYCHNKRSDKTLEPEELEQFLAENVLSVRNFQFGCRMEPTLDTRLVRFMEVVHAADVGPSAQMVLQTNGTLLNRHDSDRMRRAGLTTVHVSIDTIDEEVFGALRGGAKISRVLRNLTRFAEAQPDILFRFVVTVSKANLNHMDELIEFAKSIGTKAVNLREMMHFPTSNIVDHEKMLALVLAEGQFAEMADEMRDRHGEDIRINATDKNGLGVYAKAVKSHSY